MQHDPLYYLRMFVCHISLGFDKFRNFKFKKKALDEILLERTHEFTQYKFQPLPQILLPMVKKIIIMDILNVNSPPCK